jgi:hypothetical protein
MNCFACAIRGETVAAVAACRNCGAGLCLEHLAEAQSNRPGGTLYGCSHDLAAARHVVAGRAVESNGHVRVEAVSRR